MTSQAVNNGFYGDLQALARLRGKAGKDASGALKETAGQFEALFVQQMMKSMREASPGGGLFDSENTKFFQEMYDKQVAKEIATSPQGGIGLAEMLVRQLGGKGTPLHAQQAALSGGRVASSALHRSAAPAATTATAATAAGGSGEARDPSWSPDRPEEFVRGLWPHAERAAAELGTRPEVLLAQAALETGWGKGVIRRSDGSSSHSLFNIKADSRWDGEKVTVATVEFDGGVAKRQKAAFRAYDSYGESFNDYVKFLRDNPRYREALNKAENPKAFARALQEAGYATDPEYAQKIGKILARDEFKGQVALLKSGATAPLS